MLSMLIKVVFTIITKLFSIILQPILSVILLLFPDLQQLTSSILLLFNNYIFTYVTFALRMLEHLTALPHWLVVFLFDYLLIKYSIYLIIQAVRFGLNVYNKLKP